jgi:putative aldouronate transport system permease protein
MGIKSMDVGFATAVGLFKNVVGLIMVLSTNFLSKKITNESLI